MAQSIKGVRAGLVTICQTIYAAQTDANGAPVLVVYGTPGSYQPDAIVAVGQQTRQPITRPTMGTNRSREKDAEVDVIVSVWQAGTAETTQQSVAEKCDDLTELLDAYFRTAPQETLSGSCREAWLSSISGPTIDASINPESGSVTGFVAVSTCTITARIRY